MSLIFYIFIFFLGLAVGSFLNCIIFRMEKGEGFLRGRSYCPHCKHALGCKDLVPVLSFILLMGRCRYCRRKISWQYPLVELATGVLFLLFFAARSPIYDIWQVGFLVFIPFLIIIFVYDLKHYVIPDKVVFPAIGSALVYDLLKLFHSVELDLFISAFGAAGFFLAIVSVSKGKWMGVGDIKIAFLMGLLLGFPNILVALFLAFLIGAIIGVGLIILNKKTMKSEVPFGPFLVIGTIIALFLGDYLVSWYAQSLYFN